MSLQTICLLQEEAKRLIFLEDANQTNLLRIGEKQQLVSQYTKLVQAFDSVDPGIKYYFMHKLQALVLRTATPPPISERSIISKYMRSGSSTLTSRSFLCSQKGNSFLSKEDKSLLCQPQSDLQEGNVIQNQFKILQQQQQHKQETIKTSLTNQQQSIAKRLQKRKQKIRRKSLQKPSASSDIMPLIKKEELKRMQKDLTKRIKRATARMSKMQSLKAFSKRLHENPRQLSQLMKERGQERIQEQDQNSQQQS